jgi:endonuclease/exonuclease/phosphatase family metal-dependent hydrolase
VSHAGRARLATALAVATFVTLVALPPSETRRPEMSVAVADDDTRAPNGPVRFVTFNMLHGGPWSEWTRDDQDLEGRLDVAARELADLHPDVIALQEASIGWRRGNVAARLAHRLGLHHVHAPATEHVFGVPLLGRVVLSFVGFREGPAILSRFPVVGSEVVDLPRCRAWYDPRVLLAATLRTQHGELHVYSTHTARDDCQLDRIRDVVRARQNGLPSVVMGDFNTGDTMPAIDAFRTAGFLDAFRSVNPASGGATVWQRTDAPFDMASRRVDYVLLLPGHEVAGRIDASRVVLKTPATRQDGRVLWPSDHHGVLADISLGTR